MKGKSHQPSSRPRRERQSLKPLADREICPRCGRPGARVIGRSESFPVVYLRCDDCGQASVAPA